MNIFQSRNIKGALMNYIVNNEYNYEFENVKRIGIGTGKIFYDYKNEIRRIKQEYKVRMAVYLGIERDMYSCADPKSEVVFQFYRR